jgi:hypothetical protein
LHMIDSFDPMTVELLQSRLVLAVLRALCIWQLGRMGGGETGHLCNEQGKRRWARGYVQRSLAAIMLDNVGHERRKDVDIARIKWIR